MAQLFVMVGLQGSGKSTKAKELAKEYNATVLSSDETRKQYPEWDNQKVFNHLYKQMQDLLNDNKNVILDATNTTIKARKPIFEAIKGISCVVIAYVMTTPYETCFERVKKRNEDKTAHYVPLDVVERYLHSYQIPFYEEGFDSFIFDGYEDSFDAEKYVELCNLMVGFDQKTKYHNHTLDVHCEKVADLVSKELFDVAIFHDIGKLFTQTFKDGNAHYYNHENVGTYYLLSNLEVLAEEYEINDVYDGIEKIANKLFYINYHMMPFNWNTDKAKNKWKTIFGEEKFNNLLLFNEADKASC